MKIRTRWTGFFLLILTVWSLFLVWVNLEFYRSERSRFLTESFSQRLNLITELIRTEVYRPESDDSPEAAAAAKRRALDLVREATYPNFSDGYPVIVDEAGKVLFKPEGVGSTGLPPLEIELEKLMSYGFGDFNLTLPTGQKRHIICTVIPAWHWVVYYSFPSARASWREVAQGARTRLGLTAIGCVLLSAVGLFFLIRRSLAPIDELGRKAARLATGSFPEPEREYREDELGMLAHTFDDMSMRMQKTYEELRKATLDSQNARNFLYAMFNSVDLLVTAVSRDGTIRFWNNAMALATGIADPVGRNLWEVLDVPPAIREWLEPQLLDGVARERREVHWELQRTDSWYDVLTTPLHDVKEPGAVLILKNVTAMVSQQQQLLQAQKMETVGTLTGGLAHDFNNVLAGIRGALSMIRLAPGKPEQVLEFTALAESAVTRAAGMVRQLLALSRKTPCAIERIDWGAAIVAVTDIARSTFDKKIRITLNMPATPAYIDADPTQMEQVVLNLLVNAEQAIKAALPPEAHIEVELTRLPARALPPPEPADPKRRYWCLTVRDNGGGIKPEIMKKIFDPFFSTRVPGKGTGLGLAMVYNIIDRHGGKIDVHSPAGSGAIFRIFLPEAAETTALPPAGTATVSPPVPATESKGCILLVDDESAIRITAEAMLQSLGFSVLSAASGWEAEQLFRQHSDHVDLVFLDMAMPQLGGDETFALLRRQNPELRVILISGYPDDPRIARTLAAGALALLPKPFDLEGLRTMVQRYLPERS